MILASDSMLLVISVVAFFSLILSGIYNLQKSGKQENSKKTTMIGWLLIVFGIIFGILNVLPLILTKI